MRLRSKSKEEIDEALANRIASGEKKVKEASKLSRAKVDLFTKRVQEAIKQLNHNGNGSEPHEPAAPDEKDQDSNGADRP